MKKIINKILSLVMAATMTLTILTASALPVSAGDVDAAAQNYEETPADASAEASPDNGAGAETADNGPVVEATAGEAAVPGESMNADITYDGAAAADAGAVSPENGTADIPAVQAEVIVDENNDDVEIKENDRPYLALGADLSAEQRAVVLSIMGIDPANLGNYDVVYVTNAEEHQYLDSYIDAAQIGSRSLSSVVIVEREAGNGLNISTNNITYCTVGMYKNALVTAGVTDADIIVAGPTGISGTAALVGIFKAYQEMTGEDIGDDVIDAALNELVITGRLEDSIEGLTDEEVEEFIAYIKAVIAENDLNDEESINEAIDEACEKYGVTLSDSERQQIVDLLLKITSLGIDLNGLVDYAESLYHSYRDGGGEGILASIGSFFTNLFSSIADFFKGLFS